jgi:hypothetical protein
MHLQLIVAHVEGLEGDKSQHHYYSVQGYDTFWTTKITEARFFDGEDPAEAYGVFDGLKRQAEVHLGKDLKTGEPILDPRTKQPIHRINLPLHFFNLAKLSLTKDHTYRPDAKVSVYIVDAKFDLEPAGDFISFKIQHPQLPKED